MSTISSRRRTGTLSTADYERILSVLDACCDCESVAEFRHNLLTSLSLAFDLRYATWFTGTSPTAAFHDDNPLIPALTTPRQRRLLAEYLDHWRYMDVFATETSLGRLRRGAVVTLDELHDLPDDARTYVAEFLHSNDVYDASALQLPLPGAVAIVGLFGAERLPPERRHALSVIARQTAAISRRLPAAQPAQFLDQLTGRYRDVARLVGDGLRNADIADRLHLSEDTVKKYVSRVLAITGCRSRTELALRLTRNPR